MKIVKTDGCIVSGIDVDGVDINNISEETKQKIIEWIYYKIGVDSSYFKAILSDTVDIFGEYNYLYTCDECGDSVSETILKI